MQQISNLDTLPVLRYSRQLDDMVYRERDCEMPVSSLSAGYQSLLWMVMNLAYRLSLLNPNHADTLQKTEGIVLIDEIDMQYVKEGMSAYLTFDSMPGKTVEAYVSYIPMLGRYSDSGIGVVDVELTIDNPPASIIPGYSFEGLINVEGDVSMLIVPQAAVTMNRGGITTVNRKKADGSTETVQVQVQYLGENLVQILSSNIKEGDVLVYQTRSGVNSMMRMMGGGPR